MKYFQFNPNDENKVQKKYMQFSIDFYTENGEEISVDELYVKHVHGDAMSYIQPLTKGILPEFSCTDTKAIIVLGSVLENQDLNFLGLTAIPVIEKNSKSIYYVLWFNEFIDCVDWEHSEYEAWPDGSILKPWHNPRGRWFWHAALDAKKLPSNLDAFRLKEWGGAFNFVVNEEVKQKFLSMKNAEQLLNFIELQVF